MCAHSESLHTGRFSLVLAHTCRKALCHSCDKKKKKFAFDEIQNTQIHKLHETLLMPITTWAFQLHKPLKYSKQGNANTPASRMLIYILGAMQEQTYPDLLIESCGTCWHVLKMKGKKHVH